MHRETRATETMTDAHGTILQSHVSAVISPRVENHLLNNLDGLETFLQTPDLGLHEVIQLMTPAPLIDPAAHQLPQAMMRETDAEAIAHSLVKQTPAMAEAVTWTEPETGIVHLLTAAAHH